MKLKHIAVSLAVVGTAFGGSVTVTNNTGGTTQSVVDNSGNFVDGGYAAIGSITDEGALSTLSSGSDLANVFNIFGSASSIGSTSGLIALNGVYSVEASSDFNTDPIAGTPIYLVLGSGGDLASSSQAGVFKLGNFPASEPAVLVSEVSNTNGEVLLGDYSSFMVSPGTQFGNAIAERPAFALANIPEPSSSLLFGIAGLSLLIRRKR